MYYPWSEELIELLFEFSKDKICIVSHVSPDGDSIGSQIGLYWILKQFNENVFILKTEIPKIYKLFIEQNSIDDFNFGEKISFLNECDLDDSFLIISLDSGDYDRLEPVLVSKKLKIWLNIDHHISNNSYATNNFIDPNASAVCEIIAGFYLDILDNCENFDISIKSIIKNYLKISKSVSEALYFGIVSDTDKFQLPMTTAVTLEISSRLLKFGVNISKISTELFEKESFERLKLTQRFLSSLEMFSNNKICVGILTDNDFIETKANKDDSKGFINLIRKVESVRVAILLEIEKDGLIKTSLRSKDSSVRVDLVAKKYNGGGHACASGFKVKMNSAELINELVLSIANFVL